MWEDDDDWMEEFEKIKNEPFVMVRHKGLFRPSPLFKGDKIGIISLSDCDPEEVMGAMGVIASYGYVPVLSKAIQKSNPESGLIPRGERILELYEMIENREIKAIFCCGDGSGSIEILPNFSYGPIARNPKWLVGRGDVSALLAMWVVSDIASIHGPMCRDLIAGGAGVKALFNLLSNGGILDYLLPITPGSVKGKATGRLIGGNLQVFTTVSGTSYDLIDRFVGLGNEKEDTILFFEDSGISLRRVRDMLLRIYLAGPLFFVKGLIFGSFKDCEPYGHLRSIRDVVGELAERGMLPEVGPVVFDFPIGEGTSNIPLTEGLKVELEVTDKEISLSTLPSDN